MIRTILASTAAAAALASPPLAHCPAGNSSEASLNSVSCPTTTFCAAVGEQDPGGTPLTKTAIARIRTGGTWKAVPVLVPGGLDAAPSSLTSVSCMSAADCLALGSDQQPNAPDSPLAEQWNGRRWDPVIARPGNGSVSCYPGGCVTAGGTQAGFWDGRTWTALTLPGIPPSTDEWVTAVSCAASGACLIISAESGASGGGTVLAWTWRKGRVTEVAAPPWNPYQPQRPPQAPVLSCAGNGQCLLAAVDHDQESGDYQGYSEAAWTWDGRRWTAITGLGDYGQFGLSCTAVRSCVIVGGGESPFKTWDGNTWTEMKSPTPKEGITYSFESVSCPAAASCTAVGDQDGPGGTAGISALYGYWNGKIWTVGSAG